MSKETMVSLLALVLLLFPAAASHAGHAHAAFHRGFHHDFHHGFHNRVFIGVGPSWWGPASWWGPPDLYAPYPYGWYYPPPYYAYPSLVVQEPQMYIQQQQPPPSSEAPSQAYWYYCARAHGYYPNIQKCPEDWIKVPPTPR